MRGSRSPSEVAMGSTSPGSTLQAVAPSSGAALPPFHGLGRKVAAKSLQARLYNMRKVKR